MLHFNFGAIHTSLTDSWEACAQQSCHPAHELHVVQGHRRILGNLPVSSQILCTSPYLDGKLFHYDDKLVSAFVRPRVYSDSILRFVSKQHPETCKFKLAGDCFDLPSTHGRAIKQVIHHHFHPVLPFIMSYLQTFVAGPQICIHTRY